MLRVVLLQGRTVQRAQLQRGDLPAGLALDPADDLADQPTPDGVGLEKDEGALSHVRLLEGMRVR